MAQVGRGHKAKINYKLVKELSEIGCTDDEIAHVLHVCRRTLERNKKYVEVHDDGLKAAKVSMRRSQMKLAQGGYVLRETTFTKANGEERQTIEYAVPNATMCIWLGKQMLAQREPKQDIATELTGKDGKPIQVESVKHLTDEELESIISRGSTAIPISSN